MHFYGQVRNVDVNVDMGYGSESGFEFDCVSAMVMDMGYA